MDIDMFPEFMTSYQKKLVPEMARSCTNHESLIKKMEGGYERHYMKLVAYHSGKKFAHGLACVNVD